MSERDKRRAARMGPPWSLGVAADVQPPPPPPALACERRLAELRGAYSSTVRAHVAAAHERDRLWWAAWGLAWTAIGYAHAWRHAESLVDAVLA